MPEIYQQLTWPTDPELLERISSEFHDVYQEEARRQAAQRADSVRHPDRYEDLPEHTKDYDRALAIHVLKYMVSPCDQLMARIRALEAENDLLRRGRDTPGTKDQSGWKYRLEEATRDA